MPVVPPASLQERPRLRRESSAFTGETVSSRSDEAVKVPPIYANTENLFLFRVIFVSSRPESAERRDPGFRPLALASPYGEADASYSFLCLEVFVSF